jgi:hypothetical protein
VPGSRSICSLSLRPNLQSGMPVRKAFIMICPDTSARNTAPELDSNKFTRSSTSKYTSFFLYTMPSRRLQGQNQSTHRDHNMAATEHKVSEKRHAKPDQSRAPVM